MNYISKTGTALTTTGIITDFCSITGLTMEQLSSKTRKREIAQLRQILIWILSCKKKQLNLSYTDIGDMFNRDHSTVIFCKNKMDGYIQVNDKVATLALDIYSKIK
jgi:chromosomal replication initiation ATPase DnaA